MGVKVIRLNCKSWTMNNIKWFQTNFFFFLNQRKRKKINWKNLVNTRSTEMEFFFRYRSCYFYRAHLSRMYIFIQYSYTKKKERKSLIGAIVPSKELPLRLYLVIQASLPFFKVDNIFFVFSWISSTVSNLIPLNWKRPNL